MTVKGKRITGILLFLGLVVAINISSSGGLLYFFYPALYPFFVIAFAVAAFLVIRWWGVVLVIIPMVAVPTYELSRAYYAFEKYCPVRKTEPVIYETVSNVTGIYSPDGEGCKAFCEDALFRYDFKYYEGGQTQENIDVMAREREHFSNKFASYKLYPFPAIPGLYKFHLEPNDGRESCRTYNEWRVLENSYRKLHDDIYIKNCIVAEPIEKVSAEYGFEDTTEYFPEGRGKMEVKKRTIFRVKDQHILAHATRFQWKPNSYFNIHDQITDELTCGVDYWELDVSKVLLPIPTNTN